MGDGRSAGSVGLDQARYLAAQYGLDLVEIAPKANPPVARLLDYNKYRYQQEKNSRGKTKSTTQLKEMRLGYATSPNDLGVKAKRAKEFLEEGHFVRAFINLRGRENIFPEKAKESLRLFRTLTGGAVEQEPTQVGKRIQLIIKPIKKANA
jgi:translation initiation factor IF-3